MNHIESLDQNLKIGRRFARDNKKAYNCCDYPFECFGLIMPDDEEDFFRRMPGKIAKSVSHGVTLLSSNAAGGRIRFATDSGYIGIYAKYKDINKMSHFAYAGSIGFDLYASEGGAYRYEGAFIPPTDVETEYEGSLCGLKGRMTDYTINFPLYSSVSELYIILDGEASVAPSTDRYEDLPPIVYYGSSITQGACASRPGNSYQSIISRRLNYDYLNLGFSGSALAEDSMAEYIASLEMSAFVLDYDHNAPSAEYLEKTHKRIFGIVRSAHPSVPIICVSKPVILSDFDRDYVERKNIISSTVDAARSGGDRNCYFIDGSETSSVLGGGDCITVDGIHPGDLGFMSMAKLIGDVLSEVL